MKITKKPGANVLKVEEVELEEATAEALITAEQVSGKTTGFGFLLAALSQVGTFDGKKLPPEELQRLSSKDFLTLVDEAGLIDIETAEEILHGTSSTSPAKESSDTTA